VEQRRLLCAGYGCQPLLESSVISRFAPKPPSPQHEHDPVTGQRRCHALEPNVLAASCAVHGRSHGPRLLPCASLSMRSLRTSRHSALPATLFCFSRGLSMFIRSKGTRWSSATSSGKEATLDIRLRRRERCNMGLLAAERNEAAEGRIQFDEQEPGNISVDHARASRVQRAFRSIVRAGCRQCAWLRRKQPTRQFSSSDCGTSCEPVARRIMNDLALSNLIELIVSMLGPAASCLGSGMLPITRG
jgi:hypothetical protein